MALYRAFKAFRPEKSKQALIPALPYDVMNSEEAREAVKGNPYSFLHIDKAEIDLPKGTDVYSDEVYQKAKENLDNMEEKGILVQDQKACYYIYELVRKGKTQTGIVGCSSIDDYVNGVVKKHENTRAEKEADRIHHVDACNAQTGPIFLAYRSNPVINEILEKVKAGEAEYDFTSEDGIRHRVFEISDDDKIAAISQAFENMADIYIADGHHRAASAVKVGLKRREEHPDYDGTEEFNYFLSVLFPDDQLMIMDYNRVVKDLNGYSIQSFYKEMKKRFDVTEITDQKEKRPQEKGSFTMYMEGHWFLCKFREDDLAAVADDPVKSLDVSMLQDLLLHPVLGIGDQKTDGRIDFVGGLRGMDELVRRCEEDCSVAFAMYPTSITELFSVADAGKLMPPKSTWFEPKLRSGLFIHSLE